MITPILLGAHFLADFTLQPNRLAELKSKKISFVLLHGLIHAAVMAGVGFSCVEAQAFITPFLIIALSHVVIDMLRQIIDRRFPNGNVLFWSFVADQAVHLSIIIAVSVHFGLKEHMTPALTSAIETDGIRQYIVFLIMLITVWDPAAVFVSKMFAWLDCSGGNEPAGDTKTGRIIGKLERLIIVVLVMSNQLGGIGFVLTAKSVARFKQLEDQKFAEKYLVGTLASVTIAIITSIVMRYYL